MFCRTAAFGKYLPGFPTVSASEDFIRSLESEESRMLKLLL
jgi:hypothetical protein